MSSAENESTMAPPKEAHPSVATRTAYGVLNAMNSRTRGVLAGCSEPRLSFPLHLGPAFHDLQQEQGR